MTNSLRNSLRFKVKLRRTIRLRLVLPFLTSSLVIVGGLFICYWILFKWSWGIVSFIALALAPLVIASGIALLPFSWRHFLRGVLGCSYLYREGEVISEKLLGGRFTIWRRPVEELKLVEEGKFIAIFPREVKLHHPLFSLWYVEAEETNITYLKEILRKTGQSN